MRDLATPVLRRGWRAARVALFSLAVAEVAAYLALQVLGYGPLPWGALARERRRTAARATRQAGQAASPAVADGADVRDEAAGNELVVHPYLGYVFDPAINGWRSRLAAGALKVDPDGFFATPDPPQTGGSDRVDIALLGGSVAFILCFEGRDVLLAELAKVPAWRGKRLALRCLALGGYKQPQQLMTLAYFLALGRTYDLVINLDGFNELALPFAENRVASVNPFYPRGWSGLVSSLPDLDRLRQIGRAAALELQQAELARRFDSSPGRFTLAGGLLWVALERRLEARLAAIQCALAQATPQRDYVARGPELRHASDADFLRDLADVWGRASLEMASLSAGRGARYYHFLQPNQYVRGSKPMAISERRVASKPDQPFRPAIEMGYPMLAQVGAQLAATGVRFYDATAVFAAVEEPLYVDACCHFNKQGSELLARWMAQRIARDLADPAPGRQPARGLSRTGRRRSSAVSSAPAVPRS